MGPLSVAPVGAYTHMSGNPLRVPIIGLPGAPPDCAAPSLPRAPPARCRLGHYGAASTIDNVRASCSMCMGGQHSIGGTFQGAQQHIRDPATGPSFCHPVAEPKSAALSQPVDAYGPPRDGVLGSNLLGTCLG